MATPGTPGTPGEERDRSLRRTRWAIAGAAVGGAVLATGAVAVLNGGDGSAAATPAGISGAPGGGQFRPGEAEHDDDDHDDDGPRGLTQDQLRQLIERGRGQVQEFFGGGSSDGPQQVQPPRQQWGGGQQSAPGGGAPQTRSRGS